MKSDGVNRSNIFGITKDNHLNAVCLVLRRVAFRLSQSIDSFTCVQSVLLMSFCHLCLLFFFFHFFFFFWRSAVCSAAVEGGGRMYPISINLRAEFDLRVCTCLFKYKWNTLWWRGAISGAASDSLLTSSHLLVRSLACGCTQYLTDLWPMINVQQWLSYMGHNSKIRPIFVLYEWCSVIFL